MKKGAAAAQEKVLACLQRALKSDLFCSVYNFIPGMLCRVQIFQGQDGDCKGHGSLVASAAGGWATGVAKLATLVSVQVQIFALSVSGDCLELACRTVMHLGADWGCPPTLQVPGDLLLDSLDKLQGLWMRFQAQALIQFCLLQRHARSLWLHRDSLAISLHVGLSASAGSTKPVCKLFPV